MRGIKKSLSEGKALDFEDMLNRASDLVDAGRFIHSYDYILVDEYQDLSASRYKILRSLRGSRDYRLFCVGDDWQSIYRFNGSDIDYILDFERFWGPSKTFVIERTYRFSGRLLEASGRFVQANERQLKKTLRGPEDMETSLGVVNVRTKGDECRAIRSRLETLDSGSSVLLLGRYGFDLNLLGDARVTDMHDGTLKVDLGTRPDLDVRFRTVHGSKGLQADYVFILNCREKSPGFPNDMTESPVIDVLLGKDDFPFAEERRLFYVALTRARKGAFLVVTSNDVSPFVNELFCAPAGRRDAMPNRPVRARKRRSAGGSVSRTNSECGDRSHRTLRSSLGTDVLNLTLGCPITNTAYAFSPSSIPGKKDMNLPGSSSAARSIHLEWNPPSPMENAISSSCPIGMIASIGILEKATTTCLPSQVNGLFLPICPPSTYSTNCSSLGCSWVCDLRIDARSSMNSGNLSSTTAYWTA